MGVGVDDVRFSVVEELCVEGCAAYGTDGVVVPCFHLGDFVKVEVELVESDFLVHIGDVLDDGVCVELMCGLETVNGLGVRGLRVLGLGWLVWLVGLECWDGWWLLC